MVQTNLELAKQGDVKAITALMNRALESKGITAKATSRDSCLQIILEANQLPYQNALVEFFTKGIISLEVESIKRVKIYGRQAGEEFPVWDTELSVESNNVFQFQTETELPDTSPFTPKPSSTKLRVKYADFWKRAAALIVDAAILFVPDQFISGFFSVSGPFGFFLYLLLSTLIGWVYYAPMESSTEQATLGKMAVGISVTDLSGNRISFRRASARYFASILSLLTLGIGYFMAAWTEKKQTLHDMIADTLVVKKR